jgi:hypothetical protein
MKSFLKFNAEGATLPAVINTPKLSLKEKLIIDAFLVVKKL